MNNSIMYWKWDDSVLNNSIYDKIEDLTSRFGGTSVFVGHHWVKKSFFDKDLQDYITICADELHKRDRKLYLEVCPRNEEEAFYHRYDVPPAYLMHFEEIPLDENGDGRKELEIEAVWHYWRVESEDGANKLYKSYAMELGENSCYSEKKDITDYVTLIKEQKGNEHKLFAAVCAGKENAGKTAVVSLGTKQCVPDLASDRIIDLFREMLYAARDAKIDGVCSDEWGYDMILKIMEVNPYDDNNLFLRHFSVSDSFAAIYAKQTCGRELYEDMLSLCYTPLGEEKNRIAVINRYVEVLRFICAKNDRDMYAATKEICGADTFFGVHPTWWGSTDSLFFETFKNGFYWWEAKRDYAQTDEMVILPIRTALAHKFDSPVWYNMWYSMGTRDINTYFYESWNNARFGGRTHYLGYECPNEAVVLELKPKGDLERIEQMDEKIRALDTLQKFQPDCRVLVLFSMQAANNWALSNRPKPPFAPQSPILDYVLNTANAIFEKFLCDLIPSSEIENGSLYINAGKKAQYGTQEYDAVVLLQPECMKPICYDFIEKLDPNMLTVCGNATMYADATPLTDEHLSALKKAALYSEGALSAAEILKWLEAHGVAANRPTQGCVFQDGSMIFTAEGKLHTGNPLAVDGTFYGRDIRFEGQDMLYLNEKNDVLTAHYTSGKLLINGEELAASAK